ncbi:MAG: type IV pilus modification protein PilV, partial [Rhodoferax sp.]|nr:type IV pilus modification protein PilV [Rhodoferax sp.]
MNQLRSNSQPGAVHVQGFSMIEVLVTLLIISLALLGTAGLQAFSMRQNQGGQFRSQAVFLVADLAERMEANKRGAVNGTNYVIATSGVPTAPNFVCSAGFCSDNAMADFDMSQWQNAVASTLPRSTWTVTRAGGPAQYTYTIQVS